MKNNFETTKKNLEERVIRYLKKLGFLYKKNQEGLRLIPQADGTKQPYKASSGFPDIEVFLENGKVIFLEIKRENGKVSERQEEMFNELDNNTFTILIVRPSNWEKVKDHLKWLAHSYNLWNDEKAYVKKYNEMNDDCGWRGEMKIKVVKSEKIELKNKSNTIGGVLGSFSHSKTLNSVSVLNNNKYKKNKIKEEVDNYGKK